MKWARSRSPGVLRQQPEDSQRKKGDAASRHRPFCVRSGPRPLAPPRTTSIKAVDHERASGARSRDICRDDFLPNLHAKLHRWPSGLPRALPSPDVCCVAANFNCKLIIDIAESAIVREASSARCGRIGHVARQTYAKPAFPMRRKGGAPVNPSRPPFPVSSYIPHLALAKRRGATGGASPWPPARARP